MSFVDIIQVQSNVSADEPNVKKETNGTSRQSFPLLYSSDKEATVCTDLVKDADVPYLENAGVTTTGDHCPPFRIFVGATESTCLIGMDSIGKCVAASGCSNTAGKLTVTSSSYENVIAITVYLKIQNPVKSIRQVDAPAVVAGCFKPAIVDTAKFGVAATDAGTDWDENGKSRGDADPDGALQARGVTILAFGGAGFTITLTSSENMSIVVKS